MKQAIIFGASGLVGGFCLEAVLHSNEFEKITLVSRTASNRKNKKIKELIVNFDQLNNLEVSGEIDTVFCCLGTTIRQAGTKAGFRQVDFDYVLEVANWSLKRGAAHFLVVSAMGADSNSIVFYNRVKGEMEESIARMKFSSIDIFRPSLLLGKRSSTRPGEKVGEIILKILDPVMRILAPNYRAIEARNVANFMVRCAEKPVPGVHIHLSGEMQNIV